LRRLRRQKGYTAINVVGLAVGLACCLVIFQYVAFEYSFDRFHEHERDIFRVTTSAARTGEPLGRAADTPHGMGPGFMEAVPEVLRAARVHSDSPVVSSVENPTRAFEETRVFYTDPTFLEMFTFPLVAGKASLSEPGTVLLSETTARRYFGEANPIGQELAVSGETERRYRVTGLFRDVPAYSHLQFDLLLPMADLLQTAGYQDPQSFWLYNNFLTYVQLRLGADRAAAERKMTAIWKEHVGELYRQIGVTPAHVGTQPLRDIHLNTDVGGPDGVLLGSYRTVYFFTVIGLITLLIALVNYVNLATARALDRAREVGVRKAVGAHRSQLIVQFLVESVLTVLAAALIAVVLASAFTPVVNDLAETQLTSALWVNPGFWAAFIGTLLASALLAGLYPAFVLSSFNPVAALKGRMGALMGQRRLRQGLVVLQFAASVVLIAGTVVVRNQLGYMREMDLGMDLEQVLTVPGPQVLPEGTDAEVATGRFVEELRRLPSVSQVATSSRLPGQGFNWNGASIRKAEDPPDQAVTGVMTLIDTSFVSLYRMELIAGAGYEAFTPPPDSGDVPMPVIPTETAVRALGFASPSEAIGQVLDVNGTSARIVGVFKDVSWSSAHEARPNILFGRTTSGSQISLRVAAADLPGTLAAIERRFIGLFPGNVFQFAFADEIFDEQYRDDQRFAALFALFSGLTIAIACLGLLGLAAFMARQRAKEISVRKVLGATEGRLVALLSWDFLKLVGVAVLVAVPVAFFLMQRWLEGFAYRVRLGP
ncbi:MAG TPA: ABC transporter permease, partial [Rhodothermales bacterium]|nr:ABC transporter permease [Rhodothermales bacterium]